jgi:hypothetical protein
MTYYCKKCKTLHEGWPFLGNKKPVEYLHLSPEEKKECKIEDDFMIIPHNHNHVHYYLSAFWIQKIKQSDEPWIIQVWVMVNEETFLKYQLNELKNFDATLQNPIIWYDLIMIGLPIELDIINNQLTIVDIKIECLPKHEYHNGLKKEIGEAWSKKITENIDIECLDE